jgi:hypothetical protein
MAASYNCTCAVSFPTEPRVVTITGARYPGVIGEYKYLLSLRRSRRARLHLCLPSNHLAQPRCHHSVTAYPHHPRHRCRWHLDHCLQHARHRGETLRSPSYAATLPHTTSPDLAILRHHLRCIGFIHTLRLPVSSVAMFHP